MMMISLKTTPTTLSASRFNPRILFKNLTNCTTKRLTVSRRMMESKYENSLDLRMAVKRSMTTNLQKRIPMSWTPSKWTPPKSKKQLQMSRLPNFKFHLLTGSKAKRPNSVSRAKAQTRREGLRAPKMRIRSFRNKTATMMVLSKGPKLKLINNLLSQQL